MKNVKNKLIKAKVDPIGAAVSSIKTDGNEHFSGENTNLIGFDFKAVKHSNNSVEELKTTENLLFSPEFTVKKHSSGALKLKYSTESEAEIPFSCFVGYTVTGKSLLINLKLKNTGNEKIDFCFGFDFNLKLSEKDREDFEIVFNKREDIVDKNFENRVLALNSKVLPILNKYVEDGEISADGLFSKKMSLRDRTRDKKIKFLSQNLSTLKIGKNSENAAIKLVLSDIGLENVKTLLPKKTYSFACQIKFI